MEQGSTGLGEGSARARERKGPASPIYSVELEVFEGPLDLLLHLVRKHELDILDIPIAFVAEKYLAYLDVMRQLDLEIAGDYLVMAATLAYLKSRELLPPEPKSGEGGEGGEEEDGEDPREALIRRLVEYERFKQAAAELDALPVSGRDVFARGADLVMPPVDPGLAPIGLFNLAEAYYRVLTRAKVKSTHDVTIEPVTVAQRIKQLALMLDEKPAFDFEDLFLGRTWGSERELRQMLVVTLMSILEMVKLGVAGVQQPQDSTTIRIYRRASAEEAEKALADYDEDASFGAPAPRPAGDANAAGSEDEAAPAAVRAVPEVDLDAIEEAALLAEALAAVQEPAEPVLDYADDDEAPAANDASARSGARSGDDDGGGPATAERGDDVGDAGEAVPGDMWYAGRTHAADEDVAAGRGPVSLLSDWEVPVAAETSAPEPEVVAAEVAVEPVPEDSEVLEILAVPMDSDGVAEDGSADVEAAREPVPELSEVADVAGEERVVAEPRIDPLEAGAHEADGEEEAGAAVTAEPTPAAGPEPSGPDSDGDRRPGGLFLNTGEGLGARELDVDDEDGG